MNKFIEANFRAIIISVIGIIFVCIAAGVYANFRSAKEQEALTFLWESKKKSDQFVIEKKMVEAKSALQEVVVKFKGSHAAFDASLTLGDMAVNEKNYAEAAQRYRQASENTSDKFSKMLATYNRGTAEEQAGQLDVAIKSYEEAMKLASGDYLNPELLLAQARCWELLGDKPKATALYKEIHDKFANKSYYDNVATVFANRIQAEQSKN